MLVGSVGRTDGADQPASYAPPIFAKSVLFGAILSQNMNSFEILGQPAHVCKY